MNPAILILTKAWKENRQTIRELKMVNDSVTAKSIIERLEDQNEQIIHAQAAILRNEK